MQNKIYSYIGFCKKARKITLGSSATGIIKGDVYLLIMDKNAAKNSQRFALKYKRRFNCPLIMLDDFENLVGKHDCRLAAIRDKNLAQAILDSGEAYELYTEGGE